MAHLHVSISKTLTVFAALAFGSATWALPTGGVVVQGGASYASDAANTMTVKQSTDKAIINWQGFSIGSGETVRFQQPDASSVTLNRVVGSDPSAIMGNLTANGKVFLVNPNGILFGQNASVNVGGLTASTLGIADTDFMAGNYQFSGASKSSVVNHGTITASDGGYVALLGANVSNQGTIVARLGTIALAAGSAVTLDVVGDKLLNVAVTQGAIDALAENGGLIKADGGHVLMTTQAAGSLLSNAVNNTGVIQAQTIQNVGGTIKLLGGMQNGTVTAAGTLDASAPGGGNGGFIETSAAHVKVVDGARINTLATRGRTGTWLIDPNDYTIAASGGDITGAQLSSSLATTSVTVNSTSGASGINGDIFVNDGVTWNAATQLTLNAQRNININANIAASNATGKLALQYGQGAVASGNTATYNFSNGARINLQAGQNFSTTLGSNGTAVNWTVITALGSPGSTTKTDLQGMNGNLAGSYALGADIVASATGNTGTWGAGGFVPIGTTATRFLGAFDGLGHTISGLTINRPTTSFVGLFGFKDGAASLIRNAG